MGLAHNLSRMTGRRRPAFVRFRRTAFLHISSHALLRASAAALRHRMLHYTCSSHSKLTPYSRLGTAEDCIASLLPRVNTLRPHWDEPEHCGSASVLLFVHSSGGMSWSTPLGPTCRPHNLGRNP